MTPEKTSVDKKKNKSGACIFYLISPIKEYGYFILYCNTIQ